MPYGTVNADIIQSSVSGVSLGAGNASIIKNRIINGAMVIDQRNAGASLNNPNGYTVDRFTVDKGGSYAPTACTVQQSSVAPSGFRNSLSFTITTGASAPTAAQSYRLLQSIEGFNTADLMFGTANAQTFTLSFWVRSSVTGTYAVAVRNGTGDRSYVTSYVVNSANTWEQKSVTIAGCTDGTWNTTNSSGIDVIWDLGVGSNFQTTANIWANGNFFGLSSSVKLSTQTGATFYITGVQLEVGSSATGFEYRQYQQELALCQRYFISYGGDTAYERFANCINSSTTQAIGVVSFPVPMRSAPTTITSTGNFGVYNGSGIVAVTSVAADALASKISTVSFNVASGLSANAYTQAIANASTATRLTFSAEL